MTCVSDAPRAWYAPGTPAETVIKETNNINNNNNNNNIIINNININNNNNIFDKLVDNWQR